MINPLSKYTVQDIFNRFDWGSLNQSQRIAKINAAQERIARFVNTKTNRSDYKYNNIGDADEVLSPVLASFSSIFLAYIKIKFGAYDGEDIVINDVDATKVLLSIDEGNIIINDSHSEIVTYTIPITGATINPTFKVIPPYPSMVDVVYSGNNIVVTANKNHVAFDIEIEKRKESV